MKTEKEEYVRRMERDIKEWSLDIDEFEDKVSRAREELQADFAQRIRDLKEKRDLVAARLHELEVSNTAAWTAVETSVETAKHELRSAFDAVREIVRKAA